MFEIKVVPLEPGFMVLEGNELVAIVWSKESADNLVEFLTNNQGEGFKDAID